MIADLYDILTCPFESPDDGKFTPEQKEQSRKETIDILERELPYQHDDKFLDRLVHYLQENVNHPRFEQLVERSFEEFVHHATNHDVWKYAIIQWPSANAFAFESDDAVATAGMLHYLVDRLEIAQYDIAAAAQIPVRENEQKQREIAKGLAHTLGRQISEIVELMRVPPS